MSALAFALFKKEEIPTPFGLGSSVSFLKVS